VTHEDIAVQSTSKPERTDDFLRHAQTRLDGAGFSWTDGAEGFRAVATRSSLQLTKFGFWETFFVFREFERLDRGSMQAFVRDAVQYAFANRSVKLPRGLFAGVATFGVALAETADDEAIRAVRSETPPKHWAANEIPVVYDRGARRIHYFEKTPVWGAAYFKGFRRQIEELLAP
jgi:hypothetical protein